MGHLRVTWHHDWWGANVHEREPRVRFGEIHLYNNLWTSVSNSYCIGLGVGASILTESNVFRGVNIPFNITSYADDTSVLEARSNLFEGVTGNTVGVGGAAFVPPYDYTVEDPVYRRGGDHRAVGPQLAPTRNRPTGSPTGAAQSALRIDVRRGVGVGETPPSFSSRICVTRRRSCSWYIATAGASATARSQ